MQIATFNFNSQEVRTATNANNEPYFCLIDVANILELSNSRKTAQLDENGIIKLQITDRLNRQQEATFINEPNLYRVIFRSNKAEAVKFQNWVFDEVLPSIRKNGSYSIERKTISIEQQAIIRQAVAKRCKSQSVHYQTIYTALQKHFDVPRYSELLSNDFNEALALIEVVELPQAIEHQPFNIGDYLNPQVNQIMDYVHGLEHIVFNTTGKYPQRPFSKDEIAKGIIGYCLRNQSIELSFSERGLGFNLVDRTMLRIHDSNIAEHIKNGNVKKQYLDDIIQASVARLT